MYCSDTCRAADSLAYSPAYPPSAGSSAATKAHYRGDPSQVDLFYQNIPELDIGGSLAFSTSVRRNKSRSSAGKSLSSTAASSQSSSPVSAPSFDDDVGRDIPQLSDLIPAKSARRGHHHSKSAANASSPAFTPLIEASISPTLRPVLRYSRRAYSTTVRVPTLSPAQMMKHRRTPSGNLLEMTRARPPPESAPTSTTTSPLLLPLSPPANPAYYADGSNSANSTIQSERKQNRRSLPLSLAALTVRDPTITKDYVTGRRSAEVGASKVSEVVPPHFPLKSTLASAFASGGQQQPPNRHHHTQYKSVITPSHILGGSTSNWHPPQTYSQSSSSGNDKNGASTHHSHHGSKHVYANGETARVHPRSHGTRNANVDSAASSSDARERVTSIGTIKRFTHMTPTPNLSSTPTANGQAPARVKHLGQFGRLGIAPSAVTPISTPSVVSVSGSFTGTSALNELQHTPHPRLQHDHGHVHDDHLHYQFPSEPPSSNVNRFGSKGGNGAAPPQRSPLPKPHDADVLLSHGVRVELRSGRRRSSGRAFSNLNRDGNEANSVATLITATTNVSAGELAYQPTFSSSSSSVGSRNRSRSRGRGSARLAMTRANGVASSASKNDVPETEVLVVETTGDEDGMSESLSPRRASRSGRRQSTIRPPLPSVSLSHSISTLMSNAISSPLSSDSRPSSPDDDEDEDDDNGDVNRSRGRSRGLPKPAAPMRVRRQTEGHPQQYIPDRSRGREFSRGRHEHLPQGNGNRMESSERGRDGEREGRGRSRVPPEARLLAMKEEQAKTEDRRGRSLLR